MRAWAALVACIGTAGWRLAVGTASQLMDQGTDAAIVHLDLLDLLVLVRTVAIGPTLIQLALRLPVVAFDRRALSRLPFGTLVYRILLLHLLHHHVLLLAHALLVE